MNLLQFNNKKVKIIPAFEDKPLIGMAYYCNAEDYETEEDELMVRSESDKQYYSIAGSDIKTITIIN